MPRQDVHRRIVEETVFALIERSGVPVRAAFVNAAALAQEENLQRLERLIAARRRSNGRSGPAPSSDSVSSFWP